MKRFLIGLMILAASTSYSQACGRFRQRQATSCGSTCTQQATQFQPVRSVIRAVVPATYTAPACSSGSCPR